MAAILRTPSDYPGGKKGDVLTVEFTVLGMPFVGLNGGPTSSPPVRVSLAAAGAVLRGVRPNPGPKPLNSLA